jgi:hypothetical protein
MTFPVPGTPAADLQGTLQQALSDLVEVKQWLPGMTVQEAERAAGTLDRLAEEMAEAAAMTRALPGRPADQAGHTFPAAVALRTAARAEPDFATWLSAVLRPVAREPGATLTPTAPGSWNAWLLRQLIQGPPAQPATARS